MDKLYIPAKLKVGFNNRKDTYTGKLAYVIYQDDKGKWRKETSWENWKDDKIETEYIDNEPKSGFVINKGVGGARASYGWNARNEYIRVYDPRGFEFEISVPNLLFILQETSSLKGKGLEGEFVYSWSGKELVLLPTSSKDYEQSMTFTKNQAKKVYAKDLKKAHLYKTKNNEDYLYIDRLDYYRKSEWKDDNKKGKIIHEKGHIFYNMKNNRFLVLKNMNKLAHENGKIDAIAYADIHEKYMQSIHGSAPVQIELVKEDFDFENNYYIPKYMFYQNQLYLVRVNRDYKLGDKEKVYNYSLYFHNKVIIKNNNVFYEDIDVEFKSNNGWRTITTTTQYLNEDEFSKIQFYNIKITTENNFSYNLK